MVTGLQKIDRGIRDPVHQPVFLGDATRPAAGQRESEWLGFSHAVKWIAHHRLDKVQYSDCDAAIGFDPIGKVLPELRKEH